MRKVFVRLSDEMANRLEAISKKYGLTDLEETLRFSARFTILTLERLEERRQRQVPQMRNVK
jgi:hypothetical protein